MARRFLSSLGEFLQRAGEWLGATPAFTGHAGAVVSEAAVIRVRTADGALLSMPDAARGRFENGAHARSIYDLFLPEERDGVGLAMKAKAGVPIEVRARLAGKADKADDAIGVFELHFEPRSANETSVLMIDRTKARQTYDGLCRNLEAARAETCSSAGLLADLSHEMKTPLNAVIGFADAMQEETFGPLGHARYEEYAGHIRSSGAHLLDLVTSILDLARIEADRMTLAPVMTKPGALARECADMVRLTAEKAGLSLEAEIEDNLPDCLLDERAVRQILINLLSNAIKFTSDGEVRLFVRRHGDDVLFTVSDTGIGMSAVELTALGARFTEIQGAGVRGTEGAGLGLSLAFALAELHGGSLKLHSAPGEGVVADVRLPMRAAQSRAAAADDNAEHQSVLTQLERIEAYRREVAMRRSSAKEANAA